MRALLWLSLILTLSSACATHIGATAMPEVRFHYNEAVAVSGNEQLVLNLVRMRYLHTVQFLEPTSVVTSYSFSRNAGVGGTANLVDEATPAPAASGNVSAGITSTESPTISYQPLSGKDFVRQLAQPVGPELVLLLIQSGWDADLVLQMTVERLNGLSAPASSGREDSAFTTAVRTLRDLQRRQQLDVQLGPDGGRLLFDKDADTRELFSLLGVPEGSRSLGLTAFTGTRSPDQLALRTRSLLSTLFYASYGVEVPADATNARDPGLPTREAQPYLRIRSTDGAPGSEAYVRVPYRGRWYWIDDTDLDSKHTFGLISLLFNLMSAPDAAGAPMLTLPAAR